MSPRGGERTGAGRKKGGGKYDGEETRVIRVPATRIPDIHALLQNKPETLLPLFSSSVQAGFPSPADDYIERYLDLNTEFIRHPAATFFLRATGDSMKNAGIFAGDLLLVDRSLEPADGKIVIAAINGELTVKRLSKKNGKTRLLPENSDFKPIEISGEEDLIIWGVVTLVLHEPA